MFSERISHDTIAHLDESENIDSEHSGQNFDAPFFPSINLENTQSTNNGWAVVTPAAALPIHPDSIESQNESKNSKISTSLINQSANETSKETSESETVAETVTNKFNVENFQPELQGGFKPIYKNIETPAIKQDRSDNIDALIYDDDGEN